MNAPLRAETMQTGSTIVEPVLSVRGLIKSYSGPRILDGLDFDVAPGVSLAIIGANGCGKSTLLKCLIRLTDPSDGGVRMLGQDVMALGNTGLRAFRSKVGVVWQKHNLVPRLSALTNVIHGSQSRISGPRSWFQSLAHQSVREEAMRNLAKVGLAEFALRRVDSLSGGQSQRIAIARMLMQRPQIVLADEPDASLDPQSGEDVMRLLSNLARQDGLTLIVVSHRLEHTLQFSDHIIGLQTGRAVLNIPTAKADAESLRHFFDKPGAA